MLYPLPSAIRDRIGETVSSEQRTQGTCLGNSAQVLRVKGVKGYGSDHLESQPRRVLLVVQFGRLSVLSRLRGMISNHDSESSQTSKSPFNGVPSSFLSKKIFMTISERHDIEITTAFDGSGFAKD